MKQINEMKKGLAMAACVLTLGLTGCATTTGTPSIESSMEKMGQEIGAAMKSTTMNEFSMHANAFRSNVVNASKNTYPGTAAEQTMYQEGIAKLTQGLNVVDAQIASGDLDAAKNALKALLPVRNQYHAVLKK
jgi:soluble cytochrome b562